MCETTPLQRYAERPRAAGRPKRRMGIDLLRRVLRDSRGTPLREIIPSTMGEPLLYRHFDEILDLCAEYGVMLNLTTNGTFPQRGARAGGAHRTGHLGRQDLRNGSTGETQESVMLGSNWSRVLENTRTFIEVRDAHAAAGGNRCRVTFQMTFMEINFREVAPASSGSPRQWESTGSRAITSGCTSAGCGASLCAGTRGAIRRWNETAAAAYQAAERYRLPDGRRVLLDNIFRLDEADQGEIAAGAECPFLGHEAWVASDGRFNPCCAPDALRRTLGYFGNLSETGLYEIWKGEAYRELRATYMENALCQGCNMRRPADP